MQRAGANLRAQGDRMIVETAALALLLHTNSAHFGGLVYLRHGAPPLFLRLLGGRRAVLAPLGITVISRRAADGGVAVVLALVLQPGRARGPV